MVLQDGRQRNSQLYFRDFLVTEMKMYCVAIAQVVSSRQKGEGEDKGREGHDHRSGVTVLEGTVGST